MGARNEQDEVCANGVIIKWSERTDHRLDVGVSVQYPCCGNVYDDVAMTDLDRYRKGQVGRCEDCKSTPTPVKGPRPTCPECNKRPVGQQYSKGVVTSYSRLCWTCANYNPAKRAERWRTRGS